MRFKELSDVQRKGWYIAGTIYGACILFVGHQAGALTGVGWKQIIFANFDRNGRLVSCVVFEEFTADG